MDLLIIHNRILDIIRKEQVTTPNHGTIDDFLDMSQMEELEDIIKEYGEDDDSHDGTIPFKEYYPFVSDNGIVDYPANYARIINVFTKTYNNELQKVERNKVIFLQEDKIADATKSQVRSVSTTYPIATNNKKSLVLFPRTAHTGVINYFSRPPIPKLVFTVVGRVMNYDSSASTQMLWNDIYLNRIIAKTLMYLGVELNDEKLIQYGLAKEKETD